MADIFVNPTKGLREGYREIRGRIVYNNENAVNFVGAGRGTFRVIYVHICTYVHIWYGHFCKYEIEPIGLYTTELGVTRLREWKRDGERGIRERGKGIVNSVG